MKVFVSLLIIALSGLFLESFFENKDLKDKILIFEEGSLEYHEVVKTLNSEVKQLSEENLNLEKLIEEKDQEIKRIVEAQRVVEVKPEIELTAPVPEVIDNSPILLIIENLKKEKERVESKYLKLISETEVYISNGERILSEHLAVKPDFKEGTIRTSDADREKWQIQKDLKTKEIKNKLHELMGKIENYKREMDREVAAIDLKIMQQNKNLR